MDRKILIKKLNSLFCDLNKADKRYSEVWLSDVDYGGLYQSNKYILNVRAEHAIADCYEEMKWIIKFLDENANEELQSIWRVKVYANDDNFAHCTETLMLVYDEENACK